MITGNNYLILESISSVYKIKEELCILNFDITDKFQTLNDFIRLNKQTTFWAATNDFSKKYIQTASKLGIKNVIKFPIKKELIDNFFLSKEEIEEKTEDYYNYPPLKNSKILIVDDNNLNIELLNELLSDIGVKITSHSNPLHAIESIKKEKYDLLLLDILMPEMSGFELAETIKNTETNKNTPIIFISAVSGNENIVNGYSLGAYSYIEKPFSPSVVKAQIYNVLKKDEENKALEQLNESFVASLTHDLKSPINAEICALKQLITTKKNKAPQNMEILSELLNSAQYMKLITDKILCHYTRKNNQITLKKEKVNITEFVQECIGEIKFLCKDKNITIRIHNNILTSYIEIDRIEIKRVINNLISNAIEYSHKNGIIDIFIDEANGYMFFTVKDYGLGIDLNKYKTVFNEYMSLSKEYKKVGFGLGLNICKSIIEAHSGEIFIESEKEKGTSVKFSLPYINQPHSIK